MENVKFLFTSQIPIPSDLVMVEKAIATFLHVCILAFLHNNHQVDYVKQFACFCCTYTNHYSSYYA